MNPLLDLWSNPPQNYCEARRLREVATSQYSWAVPNEEALRAICELSPIVEIGAGTGYWASLLCRMGADILAFDELLPSENNSWGHRRCWLQSLTVGGPEKAAEHSDRTLMLCWPPYANSFAADCMREYRGHALVYIGEPFGGCTADDDFFSIVDSWRLEREIDIPQWTGIHDSVFIYRNLSKIPLGKREFTPVEREALAGSRSTSETSLVETGTGTGQLCPSFRNQRA